MQGNSKKPPVPMMIWGFAKCRPGAMAMAATGLLDRKFMVYVPKIFEREKLGNKVIVTSRYRLPPYLFVQFEDDPADPQGVIDQAGLVASQRGVQHVFCDERGRPMRVTTTEIQYLRRLEEDQMGDAQKRPSAKDSPFQPGVWVRIDRHQHFAGKEGEIRTCINGLAKIIVGSMVLTVADCDLSVAKRPVSERLAG